MDLVGLFLIRTFGGLTGLLVTGTWDLGDSVLLDLDITDFASGFDGVEVGEVPLCTPAHFCFFSVCFHCPYLSCRTEDCLISPEPHCTCLGPECKPYPQGQGMVTLLLCDVCHGPWCIFSYNQSLFCTAVDSLKILEVVFPLSLVA